MRLPSFTRFDVDAAIWEWVLGIMLNPAKLRAALEGYMAQQADDNGPLLAVLEANKAKLVKLEAEKARLIKAYWAGVLILDEIAKEKGELNKQIADLSGAVDKLNQELNGKSMTLEEMEGIEALAAQYREEVEDVEDDPAAKRHILKLLNTEATLIKNDKGRFADAHCILGQLTLSTGKHKRRYIGKRFILRARLSVGKDHDLAG